MFSFNVNQILSSPWLTGVATAVAALLYFFLMTINPNLPPAILFSAIIGYAAFKASHNYKTNAVQQKVISQPNPRLV